MEKKILVVDDEPATLEMLELLLGAYGYTALLALDGQKAIELFEQERPPLVLTDVKMPVMDGMEVLSRIKKIDPSAEVIVITGHGDMDLAIEALNLDATDFINKPLQREALDRALKRAEERIRLTQDKENEITLEISDQGVPRLVIRGSIGAASETALEHAFSQARESRPDRIIMRFSDNAAVNGVGIALLTQQLVACRNAGVRVVVEGVNENLRKIFDVVGISKLTSMPDAPM
ncbi:hypothetical protein DPQ33_09400 [Oceanidesulfovibrio indonesiensis]|uniref:Anti-anti-sigma factor n=1 Tax=Oceanidesulfovibrio indonesiensis TaxID=54767 RepID=A0A7M3MFT9_9BACT|nr:response regulator [Oceanidesulfovibrio indonesiensis]TVM17383.1 hypothetical protein DPQ33_09400 [Oceanidesulfovibrio indonesiensis]